MRMGVRSADACRGRVAARVVVWVACLCVAAASGKAVPGSAVAAPAAPSITIARRLPAPVQLLPVGLGAGPAAAPNQLDQNPILVQEGFEDVDFPPAGWAVYDELYGGKGDAGKHVWSRQTCQLEPGPGGGAAAWSSGGGRGGRTHGCGQQLREPTSMRLTREGIDARQYPQGLEVQFTMWADLPLGSQAVNLCWRSQGEASVNCRVMPFTSPEVLRAWVAPNMPIFLPGTAGKQDIEVMLWFDDSGGSGAYSGVFVDNIVIRGRQSGTTAPPTPTRTPTRATATSRPPDEPVGRDGMPLIRVPAGPFWRGSGSDPAAAPDEKPQLQVQLDAFWIDRTEVTNAMFERFIAATGYETVADQAGYSYGYDSQGNWVPIYGANWRHPFGPRSDVSSISDHPVVGVGWRDALTYCDWAGRRLPSEAEWEKAARGTDRRRYPWGDAPVSAERVNLADSSTVLPWRETGFNDGYRNTAPADAFPGGASPYGALQMAGNVAEWVEDTYDAGFYAQSSNRANPINLVRGDLKGLRGGNYNDDGEHVRAARRIADDTRHSAIDIGFRCAMDEKVGLSLLPAVLLNQVYNTPRPTTPAPVTPKPPSPTPTHTAPPTRTPTPLPGDPCDSIRGASYGQLPVDPPKTNRPAADHPDLNIGLRGFQRASEPLRFWDYNGPIDHEAPQLVDLLKRVPEFTSAWRVRQWVWEPAPGRPGSPEPQYAVSLLGLRSSKMEHVHVPDSGYGFEQGYMVLVLYASEERIALKYTKDDSMVKGYGIQLEGVCVEPSLLDLYRRLDAAGRDQLPAVYAHMPIGRARGDELRVAIRDTGMFMDPRSEPDWWRRKQAP